VILDVSGIPFPRIPPGLVILLAAAALVAFAPWWWIPAVGAVVGLFLTVGFVVSGGDAPCHSQAGQAHHHRSALAGSAQDEAAGTRTRAGRGTHAALR
jgi:hypothetical protein